MPPTRLPVLPDELASDFDLACGPVCAAADLDRLFVAPQMVAPPKNGTPALG